MNTQTLISAARDTARRADAMARSDWAPYVEAAVRRFVTVCVAVYVAGYMAGAALHRLNDAMAAAWVALTVAPDAATDAPAATVAAPAPAAAPTAHPLATMRDELLAMSAAELRRLAGVRSKRYRKAELAERVLMMA